jgi:exodeoxyribonuclease III
MRIVAWNCHMAFHAKHPLVDALNPDIAVISECACPEILAAKAPEFVAGLGAKAIAWVGTNPNKGLGVFAYNGLTLKHLGPVEPTHKWFLPVRVSGPGRRPGTAFDLMAVWSFHYFPEIARTLRTNLVEMALSATPELGACRPLVVAGDFNNHTKWDRKNKATNFANVLEYLTDRGLISAYHHWHECAVGEEAHVTHFWRDWRKDSPHNCHIDYVFLPQDWAGRMTEFALGSYEDWTGTRVSDHVPLVVDVAVR